MTKINRQWRLKTRPEGMVDTSNFDWVEEELGALPEDSVRVRSVYLSLDPTQRGWMRAQRGYRDPIGIGEVIVGSGVGIVDESTHGAYKEGDIVVGMLGWQDYATFTGKGVDSLTQVQPMDGVPLHYYLGVLGFIGMTAYFGLLDIGDPKEGETVVVSAAAGATGSLVAQIAKIKGCRVIGIAGSDEKCAWLTDDLGLDGAINYKTEDVFARMRELCPDGIDVYFDNVGGDILNAALALINNYARIVACGMISMYNAEAPVPGPSNIVNLIVRRAKMEGFIVLDYFPRAMEAIMPLGQWLMSGQIQFRSDVVDGLENTIDTYNRLFTGENFGKLIMKVADDPMTEAK